MKKFLPLVLALGTLAGCATPFRADVSRFQNLSAPQGQSFYIQPADPQMRGSLEFASYARDVAQEMIRQGYAPAADAQGAQLLVRFGYDVDNGRERVYSTGFGYGGFGYGGLGYGRLGYGGFGRGYYGRPFVYGFNDPFLFGGGLGGTDVRSYTVFTSELGLTIEQAGTGQRVFEGRAKAMSREDDLTKLVPNLISAMFTDFPGNSGRTVEITVAPDRRG